MTPSLRELRQEAARAGMAIEVARYPDRYFVTWQGNPGREFIAHTLGELGAFLEGVTWGKRGAS